MRITSALAIYLPRFALVVGAVPLVFVLVAVGAARFGVEAAPAAAGAGAVTFALAILAPTTTNAALRAGIACGAALVFCAVALVVTR
jgi:hypothetical protein